MRRLLYLLVVGLAFTELARRLAPRLWRAPPPPPPPGPYANDYSGKVSIGCGEEGAMAEIQYTGAPSSLVLVRVERQCGTRPVAIRVRTRDEALPGRHIVPAELLTMPADDNKPRTYAVSIPLNQILVLSCGGGVGGGDCVFHVQNVTGRNSEWRLWSGYTTEADNRERITGNCDAVISGRFYNLARSMWIRVNWRTTCGTQPRIRFVPLDGTSSATPWATAQNNQRVENMDAGTRLEVRCPPGSEAGPCAFEVTWLHRRP